MRRRSGIPAKARRTGGYVQDHGIVPAGVRLHIERLAAPGRLESRHARTALVSSCSATSRKRRARRQFALLRRHSVGAPARCPVPLLGPELARLTVTRTPVALFKKAGQAYGGSRIECLYVPDPTVN
jgi:hypothetical protein